MRRTVRCLSAILLASCVTTCCAPHSASPAAPGGPSGTLEIRPQTTGLMLGETEQFGLFQITSNGDARPIAATWSSTRPDVAAIDGAGNTSSVAPGTATITASGGGGSINRILRVAPNVAGTWRGQLRLVDDTRISGAGPFRPATGEQAPIEFTFQQTHDVVSGTGVLLAPLPTGAVGPVSATWESTTTIHLQGTFKTDEGFEVELTQWSSDVQANSMTGHFAMTARYTNVWGPQVIAKQCDIVSLKRTSD